MCNTQCPRQIIYDLVRSHDYDLNARGGDAAGAESGGGDGGGGSGSTRKSTNRAAAELSVAFRDHVFCPDGPEGPAHAQVVALGIEVLNFLRGRQVRPVCTV